LSPRRARHLALHTARGVLASTVAAADAYAAAHVMGQHDGHELDELFSQFLATKLVVNRACMEAVDGAMTMVGGASYLSGHPLSRLYRDVRAGPPMQPGPTECWSYLGHAAVGMKADALLA
jgi:alkylation response protein AidB-like acyl-CoA dehydrogenase